MGVTEVEWRAIQSFALVGDADDEAFARHLAGFRWVKDDITITEQWAVQALFELRAADPSTAQQVAAFPWLSHDVTEVEGQVLQSFALAADGGDPEFTRLVASLSWVESGVTAIRQRAIQALFDLRGCRSGHGQAGDGPPLGGRRHDHS